MFAKTKSAVVKGTFTRDDYVCCLLPIFEVLSHNVRLWQKNLLLNTRIRVDIGVVEKEANFQTECLEIHF